MTSETSLTSIRPQDDLYQHINGEWIDSFTIPDDRAGDGAMRELFDAAETKVRDIITSVTDSPQEPGSEGQKVADLFTSFMDVDRINELGVAPLTSTFAAIDAAEDKSELAALLARLETEGIGGLLGGYVTADAKDSDVYALYLVRPASPCPTRTTTSTTTTPRCARSSSPTCRRSRPWPASVRSPESPTPRWPPR